MKEISYTFSGKKVNYYLDDSVSRIREIAPAGQTIIVTDSVIYPLHRDKLAGFPVVVIPAGEAHKQQDTVNYIIQELIALEADRKSFIVGVGGGVVTDITGYVAAIYMRGVPVGFVPTTILAQVDAAVGGKNGIDIGIYKNLAGTIRQPDFILYDYSFLETLPDEQWENGFAEIIKHACIKDAELFAFLEGRQLRDFRDNRQLLANLIEKNVRIKSAVVEQDESEQGDRKLLNFGHTLGHAIENEYQLLHGHAISVGMVAAAAISEKISYLPAEEKERIIQLLSKYNLPVHFSFDRKKAFETLKMDKKRVQAAMSFILLHRIGEAQIVPIPLVQLEQIIQAL